MSLDQRLRDGLQRAAAAVGPDVPRGLWAVRRRARRLMIGQRAAAAILAAAVVAASVFLVPRLLDLARGQREHPAVKPPPGALAGSYRADLSGGGAALVRRGLAGTWLLTLRADGSMVWNPPPGSKVTEGLPPATYQGAGTPILA